MILRSGKVMDIKDSVKVIKGNSSDMSYVKLEKFDGSTEVGRWIRELNECVRLKGINDSEAASFACYHVIGAAKIYLVMMLGEDMTDIIKIKECLRDRYASSKSKGEMIYSIMARKQGDTESVSKFIDGLLELGMELKVVDGSWEEVIIESIKHNLKSVELRRSMILLGKSSIKDLRRVAVKWEKEGEELAEEVCYKVEVRDIDRSRENNLEEKLRKLELTNREWEGRYRALESSMNRRSRVEIVCFKCGKQGHISRWCRSNLNSNALH